MEIKIEKLVYGGAGVGFVDRMPIFVPMTVPGDVVECKIVKQWKGYAECSLQRVIQSSQNRVTPKCEHFGRCGGCQWQHIDYATQILWKQIIVEEQLERIGKFKSPNVLPTIPSPKAWNYRSRISLHKDKNGKVGFYAQGSHDLIEIKECLIADVNNKVGKSEFFTQVNPLQNENLKEMVLSITKEGKHKSVLELYCGSGNLTFPLSSIVGEITASDSDKEAINHATKSGIKNIRFLHMSAKKTLEYALKEGMKFDSLLIDPPRDGCKDILELIVDLNPKSIVYVSCNPSTLARDLRFLADRGHQFKSVQPIDMFPQTFHIETITKI